MLLKITGFSRQPNYAFQVKAPQDGFVWNIDAYKTAYACKILGAGRERKPTRLITQPGFILTKFALSLSNRVKLLQRSMQMMQTSLKLRKNIWKRHFLSLANRETEAR